MNATRLSRSAPSLRQHPARRPSSPPFWRRPGHLVLETCVEDVEGVRISARVGADRAELGENLTASGTTPSIGTVEAAIFAAAEQVEERRTRLGAHWAQTAQSAPFGLRVLIRPRGGPYVYNSDEGRAMIADVRRIAALAREMGEFTRPQVVAGAGTHLPPAVELGFVVGALTDDGAVDRGLVRLLVSMADGAPVTFHRAFDQCRDTVEAYGDLGGLGVDYVLTSGASDSPEEASAMIAGLATSDGPTVIAASGGLGIGPEGLGSLVAATGVREVHMRCPQPGIGPGEPQRTDQEMVRRAVEAARAVTLPPRA
ncbi:copper homeostasis protein CutC [Actinomyces lilanjuaniae]|uniref:Copper homeostasis protein cutC homolog n=1 Tax=Actinomyces lilanjuaniae TaxID=2321394 RepID=A0ABM6Z1D2_9ACTO|nr:copper homeostasis protein CutC [Actinomyces lilanjuaniae]AYD89052.1 copper homeostasis protein CutC [Actinomyces lilanjuaniae]